MERRRARGVDCGRQRALEPRRRVDERVGRRLARAVPKSRSTTIMIFNESTLVSATAHPRRHFLQTCQAGVGSMALASLLGPSVAAASETPSASDAPLAPRQPHFPAKAQRIIYLEMAGAPPQQELF